MIIGRCIGEISLLEVDFISNSMPQVGEYVSIRYDGKNVLGMIENLVRGNVALNSEIYDVDDIETITQVSGNDLYVKGKVRLLGDVDDNLKLPRIPAPPGTPIVNQSDVEVNVDVNSIMNRHLAILAMTGAGKSNTVSVLIDGLLKYNAPVFVFDMHGEYVDATFTNGEVNVIEPVINPIYMSFSEIKNLANIKGSAHIQERYFRKAFKEAREVISSGGSSSRDFLEIIFVILEGWYNDETRSSNEKNKIMDVMNKVEDLREKYDNLFNINKGNILGTIQIGKANVLDLSQADESIAEVLVSHVMRNSLQYRKNAVHKTSNKTLDFPVFYILEEAHILAPNKRDSNSKFWIQRVAREGRKFGLGLCLVSQSPKTVDHDALSQMNNMIILRLVEPEDQRHVQSASESLSGDLVKQLPSLNVGEAILTGLMTNVPTLVKIDEFKGRRHGGDLDVVSILANFKEDEAEEIKKQEEDSFNLGYDY